MLMFLLQETSEDAKNPRLSWHFVVSGTSCGLQAQGSTGGAAGTGCTVWWDNPAKAKLLSPSYNCVLS